MGERPTSESNPTGEIGPGPTSQRLPTGAPEPAPLAARLLDRWRVRDPRLSATKRSVRAAVLVPAVFAIADFGIRNDQTTLFAVFGSFALLLFADFGGPTRVRLRAYLGLFVAGALLIVAGTLCSTHAATAVIGMAVFGFAVLFAGAVSPQAAVGATAALLTFVLPVAVPGGSSAIGSRLGGWALAAALCIPAVMLVWSGRWHDPLRKKAAAAASALAELVDAHAEGHLDPAARGRADEAMRGLRAQYEATPYRPTGAGPTDTALVCVVSRLEWVGENALVEDETASSLVADPTSPPLHRAVARVLRRIAGLMERDDALSATAAIDELVADVEALVAAREDSREGAWEHLVAEVERPEPTRPEAHVDSGPGPVDGPQRAEALWSVDPTYHARMLAVATEMVAQVAIETVPGHRRAPRRDRIAAPVRASVDAGSSRLTFRSVWFRNSLRGAAALALAVAVVEATDVQHGFWVVLGTLSVLRSNALGTGASALRAVIGTVAGFAVGSLVLLALGTHLDLLWVVLPVAVLLAGVAPSAISFTAGQAGFTIAVVIIFNILDPVGSRVGLIRVEDVAIGAAVSVVVGLLFWPRGAAAELARSMSEGYAGALAWLVVEIEGDRTPGSGRLPVAIEAHAAGRRLDDAFRQFMNERGAKPVALQSVTHLLTGCAQVLSVAQTLDTLSPPAPDGDTPASASERLRMAERDVAQAFGLVQRWFETVAHSLGGNAVTTPVIGSDGASLLPELLSAVDEARSERRPDRLVTALRLLWLSERLGDLRRLQEELLASVDGIGRVK